jgi:hypothetical protein
LPNASSNNKSGKNKFDIFVKHNTFEFVIAKIVKGIKNIFIKLLARKKSLCIFALGFRITVIQKLQDI